MDSSEIRTGSDAEQSALWKIAKGLGYVVWFCALVKTMALGTNNVSGDVGDALGFHAGLGTALVALSSIPYFALRYLSRRQGVPLSWTMLMLWVTAIAFFLALGGMYGRIGTQKERPANLFDAAPNVQDIPESRIGVDPRVEMPPLPDQALDETQMTPGGGGGSDIDGALFNEFMRRNEMLLRNHSRNELQTIIDEIDGERARSGLRRLTDSEVLEEVRVRVEGMDRAVSNTQTGPAVSPIIRAECERTYNNSMNELGDELPIGEYARMKAEVELERERCLYQ